MVSTQQLIGQGGFGKVFAGCIEGVQCAIKIISISDDSNTSVRKALQEYECMQRVGNHPNICTPYGGLILSDIKSFVIAMELCYDGDMFEWLQRNKHMPECVIRKYFQGLSDALVHMHSKCVVHGDIKLENIVLRDNVAKFIDFGLSNQVNSGSQQYDAPERRSAPSFLRPAVDIWAFGVCVFACAFVFFPFETASASDWRYKIATKVQENGQSTCLALCERYKHPCHISASLRDMIDGALTIDIAMRWTGIQLLLCPWMTAQNAMWNEEMENFQNRARLSEGEVGEGSGWYTPRA